SYGQTKTYCSASHTNPCFEAEYRIEGLSFNTLSNTNTVCATTNTTAYTNFPVTEHTTTVIEGESYIIKIKSGKLATYFGAYFDFNRDYDFGDTLEFIDLGIVKPFSEVSKQVTIPKGSAGLLRMRIRSDYAPLLKTSSCGVIYNGETEDYTISAIDPMRIVKVEAIQQNLLPVARGMTNQEILKVRVITKGKQNPLAINSFNFTSLGSTLSTDISNLASLYYTGPSDTFSIVNVSDTSRIAINQSINFTGQFILREDTNYFWLTYNISTRATLGNVVDATCLGISVGRTNYTAINEVPTGNRKIINGVSMSVTLPQATTCESYFFDAGGPNASYPQGRRIFTLFPAEKGKAVKIKILKLEICNDGCGVLQIFNGKDTTAPLLKVLDYFPAIDSLVSSAADGSLTFDFDGEGYGTGWEFLVSCAFNCYGSNIAVKTTTIQPICMGDTGRASAIVTGGQAPYKYEWTRLRFGNLESKSSSVAVGPGNYYVKASDINGCHDTSNFRIATPSVTNVFVFDTIRNATCFDVNDGSISLSYSPSNTTFQWSNGMSGPKITNLKSGIYSVVAKDAAGCKRYNFTVGNGIALKGGRLSSSDSLVCYNYNPYYIYSIARPTGGQGVAIYQWEKTTSPGCVGGWELIPNSNSEVYDPEALTQSACFRRSFRNNCGPKVYSDTVVIKVSPELKQAPALVGRTRLCLDPANSIFKLPYIPGYTYLASLSPDSAGAIIENDSTNIIEIDWNYFYSGQAKISYSIFDRCQSSVNSDTLLVNIDLEAMKPAKPSGRDIMCLNPSDKIYRTTFYPTQNASVQSYTWKILPSIAGKINAKDTVATVNWNDAFVGHAQIFVDATYSCGAGPAPDTLDVFIAEVTGGLVGANETIGLTTDPVPFVSYRPAQGPVFADAPIKFNYLWQNAEDSSGNWKNITNSATLAYDVDSGEIKRSTYFRRVAKAYCATDSVRVFSNPIRLTIPAATISEGPSTSADDYRIVISIDGGFAPWKVTLTNGQQDSTYTLSFPLETVSVKFQGSVVIKKFTDGQGREGISEGIVTLSDALTFYKGFSPNGDNENETFVVKNILRYPNNTLYIYNREGAKLFEKANYDNSWDGDGLPDGTYFYFLSYTELGKTKKSTGYVEIRR
ncbi:MAG TPA: gliding motility-associated C-terminal domain-containing protein, partial [Cytophagaceae bacterium]